MPNIIWKRLHNYSDLDISRIGTEENGMNENRMECDENGMNEQHNQNHQVSFIGDENEDTV